MTRIVCDYQLALESSGLMPSEPRPDTKLSIADWLIVSAAAVFSYGIVFIWPATPILFEGDAHMFAYEGVRLLNGQVMYRDFFEFTFPGCAVLYAFIESIVGQRYAIIPAMSVGIATINCALLTKIARFFVSGPFRYLPAAVFVFGTFKWLGADPTHRMISPILILAAVCTLLGGVSPRRAAIAGALCAGASFFTQQRGLVATAAIVTYIAITGIRNKEKWSITAAYPIAAYVAVLGVLSAYFVATAGPGNFIWATILYPLKYYSANDANSATQLWNQIGGLNASSPRELYSSGFTVIFVILLPLCVVAELVRALLKKEASPQLLITIVAASLYLTTFGPSVQRFYQVSGLALIIATTVFLRLTGRRIIVAKVILILIGAFSILQVARTQFLTSYAYLELPSGRAGVFDPAVAAKYRLLASHTTPGEALYESKASFVYFPLHLRNPTAMPQLWPSDYTRPEQVNSVVESLRREPPRIVLWETADELPASGRRPDDHLAPAYEFLLVSYTPTDVILPITPNASSPRVWLRK